MKRKEGCRGNQVANFEFKIADMGLAKQTSDRLLRQTICGTPMYMAPEILLKRAYNGLADVWSLGCVLYFLLTGRHPFKAVNIEELKRNVFGNYTKPPNISYDCQDFLDRCL